MKRKHASDKAHCQRWPENRRLVKLIAREIKRHGKASLTQGKEILRMIKEVDESIEIVARHLHQRG